MRCASYPVKMIFFKIILSGSILFNEPTAASAGARESPLLFKTIKGRGGKEIGAYTEAIENRPACRNLSILCLSELKLSDAKVGLQFFSKSKWSKYEAW